MIKILNFLEDVSAVVRNFSGISGYRVQAWDFSKGEIPDITNCKYHYYYIVKIKYFK